MSGRIPVISVVHPKAQDVESHNSKIGPSRDDIRSTVRSHFNVCTVCKKKAGSGTEIRKCSRCLISRYCSRECQVSDWRTHKEICADGASPAHLKLSKRLVANDNLMFEIQLHAILSLGLVDNPANDKDSCLAVEVNTTMPADPQAYLRAMLNGETLGPDASFILYIASMEKKPLIAPSTPKIREEQERMRTMLGVAGMGDWPVVIIVFTGGGSAVLEVPYAIDPQAMQHARERRPSVLHSGLSGTVTVPMSEETIRENLNNHILMDKSNRFLLRRKASG
ncbi:hypothetical protein C8R44DRAFT_786237 [Mycena epipterygia]|nr:hypothetical protein C8R44DRAFT_786237 [Mycena epipterygia]